MESITITPLYAIPLYHTNLTNVDLSIHKFLKEQELVRMPANTADYSVNKNILDANECKPLKEQIQAHVENFIFDQLQVSKKSIPTIEKSWVNRYGPGDFAQTHFHRNSLLSGCYYIETLPNSGNIVFQKDRSFNNLFDASVDMGFDNPTNIFNSTFWPVSPVTGDLILFPSHVSHGVSKNITDQFRFSLAFNVFPRGQLGDINSTDAIVV